MANIIIRGKTDNYGRTRSEHERNLRKEWGKTMSDEQLDKCKYLERKVKNSTGSSRNFIPSQDIDRVK
jgi:hypothetical protein